MRLHCWLLAGPRTWSLVTSVSGILVSWPSVVCTDTAPLPVFVSKIRVVRILLRESGWWLVCGECPSSGHHRSGSYTWNWSGLRWNIVSSSMWHRDISVRHETLCHCDLTWCDNKSKLSLFYYTIKYQIHVMFCDVQEFENTIRVWFYFIKTSTCWLNMNNPYNGYEHLLITTNLYQFRMNVILKTEF